MSISVDLIKLRSRSQYLNLENTKKEDLFEITFI